MFAHLLQRHACLRCHEVGHQALIRRWQYVSSMSVPPFIALMSTCKASRSLCYCTPVSPSNTGSTLVHTIFRLPHFLKHLMALLLPPHDADLLRLPNIASLLCTRELVVQHDVFRVQWHARLANASSTSSSAHPARSWACTRRDGQGQVPPRKPACLFNIVHPAPVPPLLIIASSNVNIAYGLS